MDSVALAGLQQFFGGLGFLVMVAIFAGTIFIIAGVYGVFREKKGAGH